jgi:hypothetical protein
LTVVPPSSPPGTTAGPRDVVFVLDRSGSMEGWKMVAARRAVARMIDTLGDADRFSVLAFDSTVEAPPTLPTGLVAATDRHRFRAVEYLATVDARGGTEMAEPLNRAVNLFGPSGADERDRILVLITDGQVGNEDQVLQRLGTRLRGMRVFTIGIDRAVNEGFLRRLAARGGGSCELVESEDRLDQVMANIHRRIGTPVLTGLNLEPEGLTIEPGEVVPRRLPDLFAGSPLLILGRYRGRPKGSIAIHGLGARGRRCVEPVAARVRENPAIAAAWARGRIRQLEDGYAAGDGDRPALEKAIVGISLKYQVLCRFTAYVAVDRSRVVNEGGIVHRITQSVESPAGWAHSAVDAQIDAMLAAGPLTAEALSSVLRLEACDQNPGHARPRLARRMWGGLGGGARGSRPPGRKDVPSAGAPQTSPASPASPRRSQPDDTNVTGAGTQSMLVPPLSGVRLQGLLKPDERMDPASAASFVVELADALHLVHDRAIVHGAIEPSKILVDLEGHPHLDGFDEGGPGTGGAPGQVKAALTAYTAPERIGTTDRPTDPRTDVYGLGAILYTLMTGRPPFRTGGGQDLAAMILGGLPTPPCQIDRSMPAQLEAICLKAMAKDPSARYDTAGQVAAALRDFLKSRRKPFWK